MAPLYASSGFEVGNALDKRAYPTARLKRLGPPPTSTGALEPGAPLPPPLPRSRAFWFELRTVANSRTTISTPRLRGNCLVREIQWGLGSAPDATLTYLDIGKHTSPVAETNVATGAARVWASLFDNMVPRTSNIDPDLHGLPSAGIWGSGLDSRWPIYQLVTDTEFFLVLSLISEAIALRISFGTLYLVENIPADQVALLL